MKVGVKGVLLYKFLIRRAVGYTTVEIQGPPYSNFQGISATLLDLGSPENRQPRNSTSV